MNIVSEVVLICIQERRRQTDAARTAQYLDIYQVGETNLKHTQRASAIPNGTSFLLTQNLQSYIHNYNNPQRKKRKN
jgi:hypothetical protein